MYDKAVRFPPIKTETPANVGPTTYDLPELFERIKEGYAPFLSLSEGAKADNGSGLPAPNKYFPQVLDHIKGGNSLSYTAERFKYNSDVTTKEQIPAFKSEEYCKTSRKALQSATTKGIEEFPEEIPRIPRQVHGKLYLFKVTLGQRYGNLQEGRKHSAGPGPSTYNPMDMMSASERYCGNFWSLMKGQRGLVGGGVGPGPAEYDVNQKRLTPLQLQLERVREQRRRRSYLPRTSELIDHKARLENLPGPGHYEPQDPVCTRAPPISRRYAFLCSDKRLKYKEKQGPGPADTIDPRTAMDSLKKPRSESRCGFISKAPRFIPKFKHTPGPEAYTLPGLKEELQRKMPSACARAKTAFNTSAKRPLTFVIKDAPLIPGPGAYTQEVVYPKKPELAIFKSKIERFIELEKDIPPLGSYNDVEAYNKTRDKSVYKPGKVTSLLARFGPLTNVIYKGPAVGNPSPLEYAPVTKAVEKSKQNVFFSTSPRFKDKPFGPGPAAYHIHPMYRSTILKGTFNVTLGNPLPRERPPEVPWKVKQNPQKRLRWFYEGDNYLHCPPKQEKRVGRTKWK